MARGTAKALGFAGTGADAAAAGILGVDAGISGAACEGARGFVAAGCSFDAPFAVATLLSMATPFSRRFPGAVGWVFSTAKGSKDSSNRCRERS